MTPAEFRRLDHLLDKARRYSLLMEGILNEVLKLTKEGKDFGHSFDAVYQGMTAAELLKRLGMEKPY